MSTTYPAPDYQPIDTSVTQEQPLLVPNPTTKILGAGTSDRSLTTPANSIVIGSGSPNL